MKTCCIIGHRKIDKLKELYQELLKEVIEVLITKGIETFLFGGESNFDTLCLEIVTDLKQKYPVIKRVKYRTDYVNIPKYYEEYLLKFYDETFCNEKIIKAGKCSYVIRNQEMIDKSDICLFYYDKNYKVKSKLISNKKRQVPIYSSTTNGTQMAFAYALKKHKIIVNVCSYEIFNK